MLIYKINNLNIMYVEWVGADAGCRGGGATAEDEGSSLTSIQVIT